MIGFSLAIWIFIALVSFCIAIAPLIIWRNTNRTNRLLALLLSQKGIDAELISKSYFNSGNDIEFTGVKPEQPKYTRRSL